jgi:hypothetical protein
LLETDTIVGAWHAPRYTYLHDDQVYLQSRSTASTCSARMASARLIGSAIRVLYRVGRERDGRHDVEAQGCAR